MKKLKVTLLMVALMVATVASAQMSLGIKGGLNMSNFYGDEVEETNMKLGFHVGLATDYEFAPAMALQSGLFLSTKGAKGKESGLSATIDMMYLQVPVHFAYKMEATPGTRIVLHAGPYVAYGIGGKTTIKAEGASVSVDTFGKRKIGEMEVEGAKRFDAGLGLGVGVEFGQFLVDIGWDMGLVNVSGSSDGNIKNQNAYLSVGYKF